jgi:putative chitinase
MNKGSFYTSVRSTLFGGKLSQGVVDTIEAINTALDKYCVTDYRQRAYVFGTARHESYHAKVNPEWAPVREGFSSTNQGAIKAVTSLFNRKIISKNYALPLANGLSYYGRGLVQITHPGNYIDLGKRLGIKLYDNPDMALDRGIAAEILVVGMKEGLFTGKKLSNYFTYTETDNVNARRIINGTDKADLIADYATEFYNALILT